jgi:outer membrane protein assembly factor BamE
MRFGTIILAIAVTLTLTNCASYDFSRRYVQQGNLLPKSKIERLHVGMSKQDTAVLMGNSLLSPNFNNDRWDYVFTWRKGSGKPEIRNLTLYFTHDRLARIEHRP